MANETNFDTVFGKMATEQGLATDEELKQSLQKLQARLQSNPVMLRDLMVELGYVTRNQADRLHKSLTESKAVAHQIPGYKILGKLGKGAMAIVYKAKQISLDRTVAIKILPKHLGENPEYVERFYKEGKAAAKLNHPNIVQAIDVGEAGSYHYFVMEHVKGKTLYEDISAGKIFSEQEALDIIIQVAKALQHAHTRGLIHRDIKPKNIMIDQAGIVKLADMGLARMTTDIEAAKTEAGKAYGTPYYIAPEQIRGEVDIDGRADIYGLGGTLYHMVTGQVPFPADDPSEVMRRHLRDQLVPPDHINTSLSAGISEMIEVMMAKRRDDRYSNVQELLEDLNAALEGQPPLRAHKKFDASMLERLEQGEEVEIEETSASTTNYDTLTSYKMAITILSVASGVLLLIVILLIYRLVGS